MAVSSYHLVFESRQYICSELLFLSEWQKVETRIQWGSVAWWGERIVHEGRNIKVKDNGWVTNTCFSLGAGPYIIDRMRLCLQISVSTNTTGISLYAECQALRRESTHGHSAKQRKPRGILGNSCRTINTRSIAMLRVYLLQRSPSSTAMCMSRRSVWSGWTRNAAGCSVDFTREFISCIGWQVGLARIRFLHRQSWPLPTRNASYCIVKLTFCTKKQHFPTQGTKVNMQAKFKVYLLNDLNSFLSSLHPPFNLWISTFFFRVYVYADI